MAKKTFEFPINSPPMQNVDSMTLDIFSESLFDGYIDEMGNTNKRSGLKLFTDLGSFKKSDGSHWFENQNMALFNSDGSIYKITDNNGTVTNITNTGDKLNSNAHATFTDNGTTFVACNGGKMVYSNGTANTTYITSNAPAEVSHVGFLDQYLIANKVGTGFFYFADFTSSPTTWNAIDFVNAESSPDIILALYVVRRTIVAMGESSIEFFQNDGVSPLSRINGMEIGRGVMAKHCTVNVNGVLYFFDDKRRLCILDGFRVTQINTSFDKTIQNLTTVSDCVASYEHFNGINQIRFNFPSEKRTFIYNLDQNYWSEDSFYNSNSNQREHYLGTSYVYAKLWNRHLMASRFTGEIFYLDNQTHTDNSQQIRFQKTTGWIDYGLPDQLKRSYSITFRLKMGVGIGANKDVEPKLTLRYRDDGNQTWSNYIQIPLKVLGKTEFVYKLTNLGSYFCRQYEINCSEDIPFVIGKASEVVDL